MEVEVDGLSLVEVVEVEGILSETKHCSVVVVKGRLVVVVVEIEGHVVVKVRGRVVVEVVEVEGRVVVVEVFS